MGFRPFVYSLARELGLAGEVSNTAAGVLVEVEGPSDRLAEFAARLRTDGPPLAAVDAVAIDDVACKGGTGFSIGNSFTGTGRTLVSPDVATCDECLVELADPSNRRYRHAFISCTNCGPRFTVIVGLPYDRPATTMADLPLCDPCGAEYRDPSDRRFHAQTVACPDCGPTLRLNVPGRSTVTGADAITEARLLLAQGAVVAVKGIGGYHLACDATNSEVVTTLRKCKDRGDKPFAVMVADLATAEAIAHVGATERELLRDIRRPVVLLRRRDDTTSDNSIALAAAVSPNHPDIGVMLAYTPVHRLLFGLPGDADGPAVLVMTSGNLAGEPIVIDDGQAVTQLDGLADAWLQHDRPIHVPCDDSVVRVVSGRVLLVRRSRGYAPLPIALPMPVGPTLAVGADIKNTFCVAEGRYAWMSAHVGDMDDLATQNAFTAAVDHLCELTGVAPEAIVADRHPAYRSSAWARRNADRRAVRLVQHHHAHIASAMAENGADGHEQVIGFAFDGTGYGDDGASWGGEVLLADYDGFERAAHLAYVALPGGDSAVRNPCRMALSHLRSAGVHWSTRLPSVAACSARERDVLCRQFETGVNTVDTSSMGRLFDAMSSLAGVCHRSAYEAEAAMRFEELATPVIDSCGEGYRFGLDGALDATLSGQADALVPAQIDSGPVIRAAAADVLAGVDPALIAARFHVGVAAMVLDVARLQRVGTGLSVVALSGGVFLNALLTTLCERALTADGFRVLSHHKVPPSDAGIALGQIAIAATRSSIENPTEKKRKYPLCV